MATEWTLLAAFLVGLTGGVHCFGMCGGIVSALSFAADGTLHQRPQWLRLLAYNFGRIASYTIAGMLAGGLGAWATHWTSIHRAQQILQLVAGGFMILLGLYLAQWWMGLSHVERLGSIVWKRLEPFGRALFPVRTSLHALGIGMVWGWLPCGLVYSVLIWAISAGSLLNGALLLFCFGLGTLPALMAMGAFASALAETFRSPVARHIIGSTVILFGLYEIGMVLR